MADGVGSYKVLLKVAGPLVLQMSSIMLMQLVDTVFLSWYSAEAVAAAITAGLASWLIICVFNGTAGFTSTLVAQYIGARRENKVHAIILNGIYFSIGASIVIAAMTLISGPFFKWAGHAPALRAYETVFFNISCRGAFFNVAAAAIAGYFSGRGKTMTLLVMQIIAFGINALLDYLLIFGNMGFPRMGVAGAALATVLGQAGGFFVLVFAYLRSIRPVIKSVRREWKPDRKLMEKLIKYGFPSGMRIFIDMLAWTIFPFFIGRIGTIELAASNSAFRINSIAFFPVLGLSIAVSILVGQAQGAKLPDVSIALWRKGLLLGEVFTGALALSYILFPYQFYYLFHNPHTMPSSDFAKMAAEGAMMLRMVALYCLFDAVSIITLGLLQGAGDTRWTMVAALSLYSIFFVVLFIIDHNHGSVSTLWTAAAVFIIMQSFLWVARFFAGKWKRIEMVEQGTGMGEAV